MAKKKTGKSTDKSKRPNILLIMADEFRFPRDYSDPDAGMKKPIKDILGFQGDKASIKDYARYFPGFVKMRENAVVLRNHTIAASACVPSRAAMFTGQYGSRTGVTQTDGILKDGESPLFKWLAPDGIPTIGDWLRADGYQTHYFGKCHFAHPPDHSLEEFGFNDWEKSYPEPHGSFKNNLGVYRDQGFIDLVTTFLRGKGLALGYDREEADGISSKEGEEQKPWFAVASFTNPHDIVTYPMLTGLTDPDYLINTISKKELEPLGIPKKNQHSTPAENGTWRINLNPDGFPQDNAELPVTWNEKLNENNKPSCQHEYALKLSLAITSGLGSPAVAKNSPNLLGTPMPLTNDPKAWSEKYLQYYTYLHYAVDQHIDRILKTLEETGLKDNTIVVFAPDHGDYGAAHGMMAQKWHSAYQEAIHVPVVVNLPTGSLGNKLKSKLKKNKITQIDDLTSHIDILPTLLGLAGIDKKRRAELKEILKDDHEVPDLVGADLSLLIKGEQGPVKELDGTTREGILFVTNDMITEPIPGEMKETYDTFLDAVDYFKHDKEYKDVVGFIEGGSVCQPCHVKCVRQGNWKLVCYYDPDKKKTDQWELYDLSSDPDESMNLLKYNEKDPTPIPSLKGKRKKEVEEKAAVLKKLMKKLSRKMLSPVKTI